jgi:hypothetical protein
MNVHHQSLTESIREMSLGRGTLGVGQRRRCPRNPRQRSAGRSCGAWRRCHRGSTLPIGAPRRRKDRRLLRWASSWEREGGEGERGEDATPAVPACSWEYPTIREPPRRSSKSPAGWASGAMAGTKSRCIVLGWLEEECFTPGRYDRVFLEVAVAGY